MNAFNVKSAGAVILALLALTLSPAVYAARPAAGSPPATAQPDVHGHGLRKLGRELAQMAATLSATQPDKQTLAAHKQRLKALRTELNGADDDIHAGFARDREHIEKHKLPAVIAERHTAALERYQVRRRELLEHLDALDAPADTAALRARLETARDWLGRHQPDPVPFDPENLPFKLHEAPLRRLEAGARELARLHAPTTLAEYRMRDLAGLQLASIGSMDGLLAAPPTDADLAAAAEVQITPDIQALAEELGHDPVAIYRWVHDHIEYVPSWGAAQTSQAVLATRRGNAMDTASLLIALLRASGIPARYVHGTVRVPSEQAMRWTGGFANPDAVQYFIGQGGIPNAGVTSGGEVKAIQMEHVWVEAWLDFFPSGGAINTAPDAWVPMDASFKTELERREPLDVLALTGTDPAAISAAFQDSGEVNTAEGWIRGQQSAVIEQGYTLDDTEADQAADALSAYLNANYAAEEQFHLLASGNGEISGASRTPAFSGSLPYRVMTISQRHAALPDALRLMIELSLQGQTSDPMPVSAVNNSQIELVASFTAQEDFDAYTSYLPEEPTADDELPTSFAPYLIELTPQIMLDGEFLLIGQSLTYGERYTYAFTLKAPGRPDLHHEATITAGSRLGFALVADAVKLDHFAALDTQLGDTLALLDAHSPAELADSHPTLLPDTVGDIYHAAVLEYFLQQQVYARGIGFGSGAGGVHLLAGAATLGWVPTVNYAYGTPSQVNGGSIQVDAPLHFAITSVDGAPEGRKALARAIGAAGSWLEAEVPARYFTPGAEGNRASTSRLLHDALAAGQKIYHITSANRTALSQTDWPQSVIESVSNALNAGLEVMIHEKAVALGDSTAVGFILLDPANHAGSYLLDNGSNGGSVELRGPTINESLDILDSVATYCLNDPATRRPGSNLSQRREREYQQACHKLAKPFEKRIEGVRNLRTAVNVAAKFADLEFRIPMVVADCVTTGIPRYMLPVFGALKAAAHQGAAGVVLAGASMAAVKAYGDFAGNMNEILDSIHDTCLSRPDQKL